MADKMFRDAMERHPIGLKTLYREFAHQMRDLNSGLPSKEHPLPKVSLDFLTQRKRVSYTEQHMSIGNTYIYIDPENRSGVIPEATQ